jgi:DNA-binding PadR family transcriptional regulator
MTEFDETCYIAVKALEPHAYGVPIVGFLQASLGREPNIGLMYAALDRLEKGGYLTSELKDRGDPKRSGEPCRYFQTTGKHLPERRASFVKHAWA